MSRSNYLNYTPELKDIVQKFLAINIFEDLSLEDLFEVASISELKSYEKGDTIIKEEEEDCNIYFLLTGSLSVYKDQKELVLLDNPGDAFGGTEIVTGKRVAVTVYSNEQTSVISLDNSTVTKCDKEGKFDRKHLIYHYVSSIISNKLQYFDKKVSPLQNQAENLQNLKVEQEEKKSIKTNGMERRKWPRYYMQTNTPVAIKSFGRETQHAYVKDMSLGGMLCLIPDKFNIDEKVEILMNLPPLGKSTNPSEVFFKAQVNRVGPEEGIQKHRKTAFISTNFDSYLGSFLQTYLDLEVSKCNAKLL